MSSVAEQAGLYLSWLPTSEDGFSRDVAQKYSAEQCIKHHGVAKWLFSVFFVLISFMFVPREDSTATPRF